MRDKLKTYIDYLFAGAPQTAATAETKAEILQNTLDKYDDLIAEGKTPEAAYSLAVSGIGDLGDFLTRGVRSEAPPAPSPSRRAQPSWLSSLLLAISIMLYICCVIPVIAGDGDGVVGMFAMIAVATGLIVFRGTFLRTGSQKRADDPAARQEEPDDPRVKLRKSINSLISTLCLVLYFIISFATMAWYITWVIFPLSAAIQNIVKACFDLKD